MTSPFAEHDALILQSLQGTTTPGDERRLALLLESDAFRQHYEAIARIWKLTASGRARQQAPMSVPSHVEHRLQLRRSTGEHQVMHAPRSRRWMTAAALLLVVLGGAVAGRERFDLPFLTPAAAAEYYTRDAETMTVTLDDGSVAHLAPHSRLRVLHSRRRHGVSLEGRAFFAVHRPASSPLLVYTARGLVEVARGRLDVETSPRATRVFVVDGEVTMEAGGGRVSSLGGYSLRATDAAVTALAVPDLTPQLSWMHGVLVFRDTPLRTVARELEALYGVRVEMNQPIAERTVTAWFAQQRLADVLGVISRATFTRYTMIDGVVRFEPASRAAAPWSRATANE